MNFFEVFNPKKPIVETKRGMSFSQTCAYICVFGWKIFEDFSCCLAMFFWTLTKESLRGLKYVIHAYISVLGLKFHLSNKNVWEFDSFF